MKGKKSAVFHAILAAVCYGISTPLTKLLLQEVPPVLMASLLYLGAGMGMGIISLLRGTTVKEAKVSGIDLPYTIGMIVLDIAAPILLMLGLSIATPATVSLVNNFEIVATSMVALILFKESVGRRMWIAISLVTIASIILTVEDYKNLSASLGAVFVLLACICWGMENNCTRMLSLKDPLQIVTIKGFGSGIGSLIIAILFSELSANIVLILLSLLLGFLTYGLSVYFYIRAQRHLGAARTSTYYAFAPFIGVALSLLVFRQTFSITFAIAFVIMISGTYFAVSEKHTHPHQHQTLEHEHLHTHSDAHHSHSHDTQTDGEHSHLHLHMPLTHAHTHTPDLHHTHTH